MEVWNVEEEKGVLEKKATKKIEERDWDKCESYKFRWKEQSAAHNYRLLLHPNYESVGYYVKVCLGFLYGNLI